MSVGDLEHKKWFDYSRGAVNDIYISKSFHI